MVKGLHTAVGPRNLTGILHRTAVAVVPRTVAVPHRMAAVLRHMGMGLHRRGPEHHIEG